MWLIGFSHWSLFMLMLPHIRKKWKGNYRWDPVLKPFTNPNVFAVCLTHTRISRAHTHTCTHCVFFGKSHNIASSWGNPCEKERTMDKELTWVNCPKLLFVWHILLWLKQSSDSEEIFRLRLAFPTESVRIEEMSNRRGSHHIFLHTVPMDSVWQRFMFIECLLWARPCAGPT